MAKEDYTVTFWGVRGSRPVPGPQTIKYGGNTPCVQVQIGEKLIILDAGTGICNLGDKLQQMNAGRPITGDIFITHTHWDHIQGFPFFIPAFQNGNAFSLHGAGTMDLTFANLMRGQMIFPHFPIQLEEMASHIDFLELTPGETVKLGEEITVQTFQNNHPNGGLSFRIEHAGIACCYVTDTEHAPDFDELLINFIKDADLVIYDANYTDDEYLGNHGKPNRIGWGHSTWQAGIRLVQAAKAQRLALFHHDTRRSDDELADIEQQAQEIFPNCFAAREGMVIAL